MGRGHRFTLLKISCSNWPPFDEVFRVYNKEKHKSRYFGNASVDRLKPSREISALDLTCSKASSAFQLVS